jgi:hypothetical protein
MFGSGSEWLKAGGSRFPFGSGSEWLKAGGPRFPSKQRQNCHHHVETGSGTNPASFSMRTGNSPEGKEAEAKS